MLLRDQSDSYCGYLPSFVLWANWPRRGRRAARRRREPGPDHGHCERPDLEVLVRRHHESSIKTAHTIHESFCLFVQIEILLVAKVSNGEREEEGGRGRKREGGREREKEGEGGSDKLVVGEGAVDGDAFGQGVQDAQVQHISVGVAGTSIG